MLMCWRHGFCPWLARFLEDIWEDSGGYYYLDCRKSQCLPHVFLIGYCSYLEMSNLEEALRLVLNERSQEFEHRNETQGVCVHSQLAYCIKRLCSSERTHWSPLDESVPGCLLVCLAPAGTSGQKATCPEGWVSFRSASLDILICNSLREGPIPLLGSWKGCVNVPNCVCGLLYFSF